MNTNLAYDQSPVGAQAMPLDGEQIQRVQGSFGRALWNMEFLDLFYDIFHGSHPAIGANLANMEPGTKKMLLHHGLTSMLMFAEGQPLAVTCLLQFRKLLAREDITVSPDFYPRWIDSLIAAVRKCDRCCDDSLAADWRLVLQPGIDFISAA